MPLVAELATRAQRSGGEKCPFLFVTALANQPALHLCGNPARIQSCFRQWDFHVFVDEWETKGSKKLILSNSVFANKYASLLLL